MTRINIEFLIEGKTNYIRDRYAKQVVNMYRKHGFKDITTYKLPTAIRVVVKE